MTASMQQTTFYFVRHGETEYNRLGIMQGRGVNMGLNETGRLQAQVLAERFVNVPLDAIYTSPLRRASETAEAVARYHPNVPLFRLADLEEMAWGELEGAEPTPQTRQALEAMYQQWEQGQYDVFAPGGESIYDVQRRAVRAMEEISRAHEGETVLIVAHGRFLRVLLATLLDTYGLDRMHEIHHANTAVYQLTYRAGTYTSEVLNCTAHLDAQEEAA